MPDFRSICTGLVKAWDDTAGSEYEDFGRAAAYLVEQARAALANQAPEEPTDQEIMEWANAASEVPLEELDPEVHGWRRCFKEDEFAATIRAALTRWS